MQILSFLFLPVENIYARFRSAADLSSCAQAYPVGFCGTVIYLLPVIFICRSSPIL